MADKKFEYKDFEYDDFKYGDFSYDDFKQNPYQESDTVKQAQATLNAHLAQKPGAYQSQWQAQLDDTMNKIMNREKFSYDFNGDALYQQYKDKFIQQGKMASADVMGQAAAMTGGYGNSYAATVGNQAYQASLQNLNDIIPELYQMALDHYNQEGQDLLNQYGILGDRENTDYGRYRDTVSDWGNERNYLSGRYDSERDYDYGKYTDERNFNYGKYADDRNFAYGKYSDDKNFAYGKYSDDRNLAYGKYSDDKSYAYNDYRNAIEDEQWRKEFNEAMRQYNNSLAFQKQQYNDSKAGSGSGSSGGGGGNGNTNSNNGGATDTPKKNNATATWTLVDNGGINWFGGVDNNAKVKDPFTGETKKLSQVKEERTRMYIDAGYNKKQAKSMAEDDVLEIQKIVGA